MTAADYNPEEIRLGLKKFRGSMNELAEKSGKTREWVRLVLSGKYFDAELLAAASAMWLEKETQNSDRRNLIKTNIEAARSAN